MRYILFFPVFFLVLCGVGAQSADASGAALEVSLHFARQSGAGSNQFALWIEDAGGNYVKTIYVTRFTASGGWKIRNTSLAAWVKKSGLARMSSAQTNALTGATPASGSIVYKWDGADASGADVQPGEYYVCLEGTLRPENQVIYRAKVVVGRGAEPAKSMTPEYIGGDAGAARLMLRSVNVKVLR